MDRKEILELAEKIYLNQLKNETNDAVKIRDLKSNGLYHLAKNSIRAAYAFALASGEPFEETYAQQS